MTNDVSKSDEAEWLRGVARSRLKHDGGMRNRLNAIADLIDMTIYVRDMQADLLTRIANIIKGEPGPGVLMHGIVDLPEIIEDLMKQSGRRAEPTPEVH